MRSTGRTGRRRRVFTDEVLASIPRWVEMGADRRDIAAALGTSVASLEITCIRKGISLVSAASDTALRRGLSEAKWARLRRAAEARDLTVQQLIVAIIRTVVEDDMVDAVLDDGGD